MKLFILLAALSGNYDLAGEESGPSGIVFVRDQNKLYMGNSSVAHEVLYMLPEVKTAQCMSGALIRGSMEEGHAWLCSAISGWIEVQYPLIFRGMLHAGDGIYVRPLPSAIRKAGGCQ